MVVLCEVSINKKSRLFISYNYSWRFYTVLIIKLYNKSSGFRKTEVKQYEVKLRVTVYMDPNSATPLVF